MSRDNTEKRKRTQEEKKKLTVRVIAVIMVVLMILGAASYTITILASAVNAAETDTIDTSSLKQSGDVLITVGLMVGDETPSSLEVTSEAGFVLGSQQMDGDRDFRTVWELENRKITLAPAANLSSDGAGFEVASSERTTDLGGYRIEVNCADCDRYDLEDLVYDIERSARRMGFSVTPAYVHGQFALRLGAYTSWEDAYDDLEDAEDLFPDRRVSVVGPSTTGVSVIDPSTYEVIFEFDCDGGLELGVGAEEDRNGNTYVKVPAGNIYDGVLAFRRAPEGVAVINVVPLESYIAGVLPYETSNEWPLETQKAFAVTVRSFTLSYCGEKGKHKSLGYDLCP
ncbi:MAG: SpoIID/LytB domain-containing protein, partial [Clostridia bacterium]|nr:SpoIID/LytB domain-containing protein [Clostridia bacterium]